MIERRKSTPSELLLKLTRLLNEDLARYRARQRGQSQPPPGAITNMQTSESRVPISLESHLALRIERAVAPLRFLLHESDLRFIRSLLREKLDSDPNLSRLVARLAGRNGVIRKNP